MTDPVHAAMSTAKGNVQKYYVKVKKTGSFVVMYAHEAFDARLICVEKHLHIVALANQLANIKKRENAGKRPREEEEHEASNSRKRPKTSSADSTSDAVSSASTTSQGSAAEQNNYQHSQINLHVENKYYVSVRNIVTKSRDLTIFVEYACTALPATAILLRLQYAQRPQ